MATVNDLVDYLIQLQSDGLGDTLVVLSDDEGAEAPIGLTPTQEAELARLEATFDEQGGRGVALAERIDELRACRDGGYISLASVLVTIGG